MKRWTFLLLTHFLVLAIRANSGEVPVSKIDDEWITRVRKLSFDQQKAEVVAALRQNNPEWKGEPSYLIPDKARCSLTFIHQKGLSDLTPILGLSELYEIHIKGPEVQSFAFLEKSKLEHLILINTSIKDLEAAKNLPLTVVNIALTQVTSLEPLKGKELTYLCVNDTPVTDLSPIKGMPIKTLYCLGAKIKSLEILKDLPKLEEIMCDVNSGRDLQMLKAVKTLRRINKMSPADFFAQAKPAKPEPAVPKDF